MSSEKNKNEYFSDEVMTEKYFSDTEWNKKLQELQYKYENKVNKRKFKEFRDSIGELVNHKLVIKDEAKEAFRIGKAGERFEARLKKLSAPERLYRLEVEGSLLAALSSIIQLYKSLPKEYISDVEKDFIQYLRDAKSKLQNNLNHKRDRLKRPEVYSDINKRYNTQKRER